MAGMPEITAVCRVHTLLPDEGTVGVTAIDKRPVDGRVRVGPYGLYADVQADRKDHGGLDQAVYAYADEDAAWWSGELGRDVVPGLFGENLRTTGLPLSDAVIGEQWTVGDDGLVLEVTLPRTPCATFARRLGEQRWVRRFTEVGSTGTYLRVVTKGTVGAGDQLTVTHRPAHGVTVRDVFTGPTPEQARNLLSEHEAGSIVLSGPIMKSAGQALTRV